MSEQPSDGPTMRPDRAGPALVAMLVVLVLLVGAFFAFRRVRDRAGLGSDSPAFSPVEAKAVPAAQTAPTVQTSAPKVFESPLAGQWYVGDKDRLAAEIDGYLAKATEPLAEVKSADVHALILPHAGYRYSGQTAAYGVKTIVGRTFDRVIVMGPSHRVPMQDVASVTDATAYSTPLGEVPIDLEFVKALKQHPEFRTVRGTDETEHSVQIEVPLLQRALGKFRLVPIVVGDISADATRVMAGILGGLVDENTLVVASSDFTHYGDNYGYIPFRDNIPDNLKELDMGAFDEIEKKDADGLRAYCHKTGATICGRCPIGILLAMLPPDSEPHLLRYDTSGALLNDFTNSVSYMSVAFTGKWPKGAVLAATPPVQVGSLSDEDKQALLKLARATIVYTVEHRKVPSPEDLGASITPGMKPVMGAFVTLKKHGDLRGCIGEIIPRQSLYQVVMRQAENAAFNDPRFPPVLASELPDLDIEISAYAEAPKPVASYKDVVLGRDGVVLEKDGRSALFLPQVAPEQGWNIEETLTHLARKAGLPPDAWKEAADGAPSGAKFSVFQAIVFGEKTK